MICETCWGRVVVRTDTPGAAATCPECDGQGTVEVEEPARLPMFTVPAGEGSPALV